MYSTVHKEIFHKSGQCNSWRVQNFVVIGWACFIVEHSKFWSNFEFDRNIVNGRAPGHTKVSEQNLHEPLFHAWLIKWRRWLLRFAHRPHSRQVTGVRCTKIGVRQSLAEYPKANNRQQAKGVGDIVWLWKTQNPWPDFLRPSG